MTAVVLMVIFVPGIKVVFGLAGATVATMLVIIMPAGFYYKVPILPTMTSISIVCSARPRAKGLHNEANQLRSRHRWLHLRHLLRLPPCL